MADLEKLLLEAAGRTSGSSGRKRQCSSPPPASSRRRRDSDDGTDSKDDESDDNRGYVNRKPSGSQIPLKKRLDSSERDENQEVDDDDDRGGDSESGDDEIYGSDLYKDEDDRQKLGKMTELERETILSERADKIKDKKIREDMKSNQILKKTKNTPLSSSGGLRSSTRTTPTKTALIELKAKRQNKKQQDSLTKQDDSGKWRSNKIGASPSSSSEDDDDGRMNDNSDEDNNEKTSKIPSYEDIKEITIRRSKLEKWFMEPFFDELIAGCFVRVGIAKSRTGPIYRLCLVRNVDASDPDRQYKLENKLTHKYLNVVWGNENSAARWEMTMISNSRPTREEYEQWVREVERYGGRTPNKQDILEKKESIEKTNNFVYNADTVKQMLLEKKAATWRPLNVAAEKDRLRKEIEVANSKNKVGEVARMKSRLKELDECGKSQEKDSKAMRLSEMNKKNRFENFKNASELKPMKMSLKVGEDGYDPFSRRWTKSVNYYLPVDVPPSVVCEDEEEKVVLREDDGSGKLVDGAREGPVGEFMESSSAHNFDIVVSLDGIRKFGGVQEGLMARKQRIEATVGVKVPMDDGKKHPLTLSVSDYKRRRGLL
ncbi:protein RTF1 homolog [Impatiens glandulifera]|uniref:protein RTF1 homolog n=1 Tax=Impatiens glandulifera TaxID=253017 RepID=UPI001FB05AB3|nr:protein RTF1 homolog [Impatiens glandulifera]